MKNLLFCFCIIYSMVTIAQNQSSYPSSTIGVSVSNLEKSIEWYRNVLGEIEYISPAEGVVEFALNDKTWLQLYEGELTTNSILRLEVKNIQSQHERLRKLSVSLTSVEIVPNVISYFDFKDPDGNQMSFYSLE